MRALTRILVLLLGIVGYERALHPDGFALCTVTLPDFALGSMIPSAEYVVAAARTAIERSGQQISIIGHSQGGLLAAWVTRFRPDVAAGVTTSSRWPARSTAPAYAQ